MEPLIIKANRKEAKSGAITIGVITALFLILILAALLTQTRNEGETGLFTWVFGILFFGWMITYLILFALWLYKLSSFQGSLITIDPHGITDHFEKDRFLKWDEIEFIEVKTSSTKGVSSTVFRIVPNKRLWQYSCLKFLGRPTLRYPMQHLSVSAKDIIKYIRMVGPTGIVKT